MRLSSSQVEAIKQETEHFFGAQTEVWLFGSRVGDNQRGFTLVELITVIIIVGILAVAVAPRFLDANIFKTRGIADQVQASLRYAQKIAIAQRKLVSVNLTTGTSSDCGLTLASGNVKCQINLPSGVTITPAPPQTFTFNGLGQPQPNAQSSVAVAGAGVTTTINIDAETGYVHSP
jgi:MSHA pilin protein MshC